MKIRLHKNTEGIALVITLIMLAVTLVMAVAFLAISTRERGSVTSSTDANHARLATEAALAHAEAQVIASIVATTNAYNFGMFVSTNFINRYGFDPGAGANPTNVNYDYEAAGGSLSPSELQQNIANLEYLPRAPVFVPTNPQGNTDFRYYLDLNRNHRFDDTGNITNMMFIADKFTTNGLISAVGDPQWIGVLEHPDQPHGPLNPFIARYAFIAVPVGNTLDINAIYNDATRPDQFMQPGKDGFIRNEGVGSWEINLAAFLADLNTNEWDAVNSDGIYNYQTAYNLNNLGGTALPNTGGAFDDALSMLRYRYADGIFNQPSLNSLYYNFPNLIDAGNLTTAHGNTIDEYSDGPLMTNSYLPLVPNNPNAYYHPDQPWPGADNTNHFFGLSDFFNPNIFRPAGYVAPTIPVFTDRLLFAGTNIPAGATEPPTYDRYTFYRMLEQLGSDSAPQVGKLNINYNNVDVLGDVLPALAGAQGASLNLWTNAQTFFTTAADLMLRSYSTNWALANYFAYTNTFGAITTNAFGIHNIPVLVSGQFVYTPSVQRLLQLAANIYDATTNNPYPSVFRPQFTNYGGDIYIVGYTNVAYVTGLNDPSLAQPYDLAAVTNNPSLDLYKINIYGVPWIVGAKKGLPNFNELKMQNTAQVTRKLQFTRPTPNPSNASGYKTNQLYIVGITNYVGVSLWNSYDKDFTGVYGNDGITIYMSDNLRMVLTNDQGYFYSQITNLQFYASIGLWPGSAWTTATADVPAPVPSSFIATNWSYAFLPESAYQFQNNNFVPNSNLNPPFETNYVGTPPVPQLPNFGLSTTNWIQAFVLDTPPSGKTPDGYPRVIDYVQLSGPSRTRSLNAELADPVYPDKTAARYMWSTNGYSGAAAPPYGVVNQIVVSQGGANPPPGGQWAPTTPSLPTTAAQTAFFSGFWAPIWNYAGIRHTNNELAVQAPYTPTRTIYDYTLWQANDPLVHYLASDLNYIDASTTGLQKSDTVPANIKVPGANLKQIGERYQPWGLSVQMAKLSGVDTNSFNLAYKDPMVRGSDDWDFPTNLFPNIGWLGRVHRGTPWQTVYLKSTDILSQTNLFTSGTPTMNPGLKTWMVWSGDTVNPFDATNTSPAYDRWLFDLFTAAPNQNATLGQLSVNQPHLAAWSAIFSGLPVLTNKAGTNLTLFEIAGTNGPNSYLAYIWNSILSTRTNLNLFPKQVYPHLGDVLAAPGLTVQSPFLSAAQNDPVQIQRHTLITDEMYEWLPQQTLGLLKVGTPRYVVYCYGQALKPAPGGTLAGGTYALMNTNYTVVAESAVRAVVEVQGATGSRPNVVLKNVNPLPPD